MRSRKFSASHSSADQAHRLFLESSPSTMFQIRNISVIIYSSGYLKQYLMIKFVGVVNHLFDLLLSELNVSSNAGHFDRILVVYKHLLCCL